MSKITLWDNAGNHASYTGLNALPITVTANSVVSASKFAATPDPVNNWTQNQTVQISMTVSGAKDGVAAIYVDFRPGDPCPQPVTTPTAAPDGLVSVPVSMLQIASSCQVTGIAVVDGAGDLALYGSEYGAPDPGLTLSRVPDTAPPLATSASRRGRRGAVHAQRASLFRGGARRTADARRLHGRLHADRRRRSRVRLRVSD